MPTQTHTHTAADMLPLPDRHLSLSLCGCKVVSLLRNNKHSPYHTFQMPREFQRGEPAGSDKPRRKLLRRRRESTLSPLRPSSNACRHCVRAPIPSVVHFMTECSSFLLNCLQEWKMLSRRFSIIPSKIWCCEFRDRYSFLQHIQLVPCRGSTVLFQRDATGFITSAFYSGIFSWLVPNHEPQAMWVQPHSHICWEVRVNAE